MTELYTAIFGFCVLYLALEFLGYWIYRANGWTPSLGYFIVLHLVSALLWNAAFENQPNVGTGAQIANGAFMCINIFILIAGMTGKKEHEEPYKAYLDKKISVMTPTRPELVKAAKALFYHEDDLDSLSGRENKAIYDKWKELKLQELDDPFEWRRLFRDNSENATKTRRRNWTVFLSSMGVTILVAVLLLTVPSAQKYSKAVRLMNNGQYSEAAPLFKSLKEYNKSEPYYNYCMAQEFASEGRYSSASIFLSGIKKKLSKSEYPVGYVAFAQMVKEEEDKARAESEKLARERYNEEVRTGIPFVGMYESDIGKTKLGKPNGTPWHNYDWERGKKVQATIYEWHRDGYVVFSARCLHGTVEQVWDDRRNPWKKVKSSTSSSIKKHTTSSGTGKKKTTNDDPLDARSYDNPEDFYDDCYDDFFDYEEAEDYYYEHGGR